MGDDRKLRSDTMRYSIIDGSLWSVMVQAGTSFLTPFAIAVNAPLLVIGALNAVPPFLDGAAQKIGAHFSDFGWERKRILVWGVAAQALIWLLMAVLAYHYGILDSGLGSFSLVALATLIFFFGGVVNPAWFAMMGDVVPEKIRASWFGQRNRLINAVGIAAMLLAGFFLDAMKTRDALLGFAGLFAIAFAARLAGAYFLNLHWDPKPQARKEPEAGAEAKDYALLLALVFFSINISGNYLPVYLLGMLKFDYIAYAAALVASSVTYVLAAPHWGRLIDRYGTKKVLVASVALMAIPSLTTLFVYSPAAAVISYAIAGIIWAGVVISYMNYLYDVTAPAERIKATGHAYLLLGAGTLLGTMAGWVLLSWLGTESIFAFQALFVLSALLRLAIAWIVHSKTREVGTPPGKRGTLELMARIIIIYPFTGLAYDLRNLTGSERKK